MADPKLDFDPILGWEDTTETVFKTNPDDIEVRPMFQRLHSQIRDFINNTLIAWIKANYTMAIDVLTRTNTDVFTPTAQYHPATKKYVDDTTASVVLGQIPDGSLTDVKLSYEAGQIKDVVTSHLADYVRNPAYGAVGGAVNAYTFSAMAATALVDGMSVYLDNVIAANTGASTFNWSGLGAKAIVDSKGNALTAGKMPLNCIIGLRYNLSTTSFQLLGEGSDTLTGNLVANDLRSGITGYSNNPLNKITGSMDLTNKIAANIKSGITIDGTLGTLIDGTGMKKGASGSGTTDASQIATVTGLTFTPRLILVTCNGSTTIYKGTGDVPVFSYNGSYQSTSLYNNSWVVTASGFSVKAGVPSYSYTWEAYI